jgi:hypothetical protein
VKLADCVLNLLVSANRIDFFLRTLIFTELYQSDSGDWFNGETQWSRALFSLFACNSRKWIQPFIRALSTPISPLALLNIVLSFFRIADDFSLYFMRAICLSLVAFSRSDKPDLGFRSLVRFFDGVISHLLGTGLSPSKPSSFSGLIAFLADLPPDSPVLFQIRRTMIGVMSDLRKIEGKPEKVQEDARGIYQFMIEHTKIANKWFRAMMAADRSAHPLIVASYQCVRYRTDMSYIF